MVIDKDSGDYIDRSLYDHILSLHKAHKQDRRNNHATRSSTSNRQWCHDLLRAEITGLRESQYNASRIINYYEELGVVKTAERGMWNPVWRRETSFDSLVSDDPLPNTSERRILPSNAPHTQKESEDERHFRLCAVIQSTDKAVNQLKETANDRGRSHIDDIRRDREQRLALQNARDINAKEDHDPVVRLLNGQL
jgi:hypothetical protein